MQGGIVGWGLLVLAASGWFFGSYSYYLLRKWARMSDQSRIAIYYNRRPVLQAPITDWMLWARQLSKDEASKGRIVYRGGKMSVVVVRPGIKPGVPGN